MGVGPEQTAHRELSFLVGDQDSLACIRKADKVTGFADGITAAAMRGGEFGPPWLYCALYVGSWSRSVSIAGDDGARAVMLGGKRI